MGAIVNVLRIALLPAVLLFVLGAQGGGCGTTNIVGVQDYGSITGRVIDSSNNQPIPSALVSVGELFTASADTQGVFTLPRVPVGQQSVTARSPGYATASVTVTVTKNQTVAADLLKLRPLTGPGSLPSPTQAPEPTPSPTPSASPSASASPSPTPSG